MTNKTLDILIVDDREENRKAAQEYFITRSDVKLDFAVNYNEGLQKLQEGLYAFGIFDLELPKTENTKPEKLGFELGKEATKYLMPWAVITSGIDHHKCEAAFVSYCWGRDKKEDKYKMQEITEIPKKDSRSWKKVYETLFEKMTSNKLWFEKLMEKKANHKKNFEKPYPYILDSENAEMLFKISAKVV